MITGRNAKAFAFAVAAMSVAAAQALAGGVTLENSNVTMTIDGKGHAVSIKEVASGRELLRSPKSLISVYVGERQVFPVACSRDASGRLVFDFHDMGQIVLSARDFGGGWTFTTERFGVSSATAYLFGRFNAACAKWRGTRLNAWSDEQSMVCVRGYEIGTKFVTHGGGSVECLAYRDEVPFEGLRFGIAAGPRAAMVQALRAMTLDSGIPHSQTGGAWSLGAEDNRRSYLMCYGLCEFTADDWIELCLRGGFGTFHVDECWVGYGHYDIDPARFPSGRKGLKECVDRAHRKGLTCDVHTLTSCVGFKDSWITPEVSEGLAVTAEYTLGCDLPADADTHVLVVNEKPSSKHDFVTTYLGNGNYLKVGTELVQYSGVSKSAPWTFTGVKRGALGTTVKEHKMGDRVVYPRQRFFSFLADADSELAEKVAAAQGDLFGVCGFDQIYLDGLDGVAGSRKADKFARMIFGAAYDRGKPPLYEDSLWIAPTWWFHSRIGANDYVFWGVKRSLDRRFEARASVRQSDLLELDMGWWCTLLDNDRSSGYKLDDHEYFGKLCAAFDTAMSVHPGQAYTARSVLPPSSVYRYMTVLGWYERFRTARAFSAGTLEKFREKGSEYRLRQDDDGVWRVRPLVVSQHRILSDGAAEWSVRSCEPCEASVRVEVLENAAAYDDADAIAVLDPRAAGSFSPSTATNVSVSFEARDSAERGSVLRICAANAGAKSRGAWACVTRAFPRPDYFPVGKRTAFGLWVKGDGSGALLNVQLQAPREYSDGLSEHYLTLDFRGWRYVEFHLRERDSLRYADYDWPYEKDAKTISYPLERVKVTHLGAVNVWLNEIPAGGRTEVEISEVRLLPIGDGVRLDDVAVTVNGREHAVPFSLGSKEWAELDGGYWTHYTSQGVPVRRFPAKNAWLASGENPFSLKARPSRNVQVRAMVTTLALGAASDALRPDATAERMPRLAYEAVEPMFWAPSRGYGDLPDLVTRPQETATLSFEVYGPISPFAITVGSETREFPFSLTSRQYITCSDGRHWQLKERSESFGVKRIGEIVPFSSFSGRRPVRVTCERPESAFVRLDFAKHYVGKLPAEGLK